MSVISEQPGRGEWEAARFPEYSQGVYSRFLCGVEVGDKRLMGILLVKNRYGDNRLGELLIPMRVTRSSRLAAQTEGNRSCFTDPKDYDAIAKELGLVFRRIYYGELQVTSLTGNPDKLGVESSLIVSNRSPGPASEASKLGDTGAAMGLAQYIMDTLPGGWQITPEPVISR